MRRRLARVAAAAAVTVLVAAGCADDGPTEVSADPSASPSADASSSTPAGPAGGTAADPAEVEATSAPLDWQQTGGSAEDRRIVGPRWTSLVDERGTRVAFSGPGDDVEVAAGDRRVISEVLMGEQYAVVVAQDELEQRPNTATVVDLRAGDTRRVTSPEPATGGSWAVTDETLHYPTFDGGDYCLATADLGSAAGEVTWCAPRRSGFSRLVGSPAGTTLMTFDDALPVACRTLAVLEDGEPEPLDGVEECTGWEAAATTDGAVWSTVPDERRNETGEFWARRGEDFFSLGTGTTGTLTPCGGSTYFVRDAQGPGEPARLLRWTPAGTLEVAYQSTSRGNAFLAPPECAAGVLTVSAFGEQGDTQVTATAP
jgi:hypothetical protein